MNIVILDAFTTTQNELNFNKLNEYGSLTIYDRTQENLTVERTLSADILLTNKTLLPKSVIEKLPNLKYIGLLSTGCNVVDLNYTRERNIPVCNIPAYSTNSVAQLVFALILELTTAVAKHSAAVKNNEWTNSIDFCFLKQNIIELNNKTIGIIGYGNIGKEVAKIATAFSMNVIAYNRSKVESTIAKMVELDEIFSCSDIITLHCSLNENNAEFINKQSISKMKKNALLINTARGGLINENDLSLALNNNLIGGYGADVLSCEPPDKSNPLLYAKNTYITPHIAWATKEARERLIEIAIENVKAFINGKLQNCVNL